MSGSVIPFTGEWHGGGRDERPPALPRADACALFDARQIMEAKKANDDWTARLLLALLETAGRDKLRQLEFRLLGPDMNGDGARQALAIVQLVNGGKAHRERVRAMLDHISGRE